MYNLTPIQGSGVNVYELLLFGNNATEGLLLGGFMLAIFFVMLFRLNTKNEFSASLLASSFVCFILSAILAYGKLLGLIYPLGFLAMLAFDALYMYASRRI